MTKLVLTILGVMLATMYITRTDVIGELVPTQ
jgi:hypothetical protein